MTEGCDGRDFHEIAQFELGDLTFKVPTPHYIYSSALVKVLWDIGKAILTSVPPPVQNLPLCHKHPHLLQDRRSRSVVARPHPGWAFTHRTHLATTSTPTSWIMMWTRSLRSSLVVLSQVSRKSKGSSCPVKGRLRNTLQQSKFFLQTTDLLPVLVLFAFVQSALEDL